MNIKQFRRHLETLPDDALVVFQPQNPDTSLAFPAMAVSFSVKPILLPDGKVSILAIVGLSPENRGCTLLLLTETEFLYKGVGGFYFNIVDHRLFDRLSDDGLVMFSVHHEADFSLGKDFFPAIGVASHVGPTGLPDGKESMGISIEILTNGRPYRVIRGIEYAETDATATS